MRILVTGSRDWGDEEAVTDAMVQAVIDHVDAHPELGSGVTDWVTVVHGACATGADEIADSFCRNVTYWKVERHPADWEHFGKAAGFRRNAEMVEAGADLCLAFIKNDSKGASHTAALAEQSGIRTVRFTA